MTRKVDKAEDRRLAIEARKLNRREWRRAKCGIGRHSGWHFTADERKRKKYLSHFLGWKGRVWLWREHDGQ